jgi:glycosyltransferase involved in cell wall biosynthesis
VLTAAPTTFPIVDPKVRAIGHGIDTAKFTPPAGPRPTDRPFTFLTVGRIAPVKNLDRMIEAFADLRREIPEVPVRFVVVGRPMGDADIAYLNRLLVRRGQLALDDAMEFRGALPFEEVNKVYEEADCFVSVSETGGIDKAVLEAMSCGVVPLVRPIYAPLIPEDLRSDLVVGEDVASLVAGMRRALERPDGRQRVFAERLRVVVANDHSITRVCQVITEALEVLR